ncbi:phosphoprotein [Killamcar virus 1]|nr:phosphoprotein [Killamcar virus 1]
MNFERRDFKTTYDMEKIQKLVEEAEKIEGDPEKVEQVVTPVLTDSNVVSTLNRMSLSDPGKQGIRFTPPVRQTSDPVPRGTFYSPRLPVTLPKSSTPCPESLALKPPAQFSEDDVDSVLSNPNKDWGDLAAIGITGLEFEVHESDGTKTVYGAGKYGYNAERAKKQREIYEKETLKNKVESDSSSEDEEEIDEGSEEEEESEERVSPSSLKGKYLQMPKMEPSMTNEVFHLMKNIHYWTEQGVCVTVAGDGATLVLESGGKSKIIQDRKRSTVWSSIIKRDWAAKCHGSRQIKRLRGKQLAELGEVDYPELDRMDMKEGLVFVLRRMKVYGSFLHTVDLKTLKPIEY